jgi:hypothetical protein
VKNSGDSSGKEWKFPTHPWILDLPRGKVELFNIRFHRLGRERKAREKHGIGPFFLRHPHFHRYYYY